MQSVDRSFVRSVNCERQMDPKMKSDRDQTLAVSSTWYLVVHISESSFSQHQVIDFIYMYYCELLDAHDEGKIEQLSIPIQSFLDLEVF